MRRPRLLVIGVVALFLAGLGYLVVTMALRRNAEQAVVRAATFLQRGEVRRARDELQDTLRFNPSHPKALQLVGFSYAQQQKWPEAIAYLERIPPNVTAHDESQIPLAAALIADRQLERAEAVLGALIEKDAGSLMAARMLSGLLLAELRKEEAVAILEQFLQNRANAELRPDDRLLILRDLMTAEFHPPTPAECLPTLQEAFRKDQQQPSVRLALGQCESDAGHLVEAEGHLVAALQQQSHDWRFRAVVCQFLLDAGTVEEAERVFRAGDQAVVEGGNDHQKFEYWTIRSRIEEACEDDLKALQSQDQAAAIRVLGRSEIARRGKLLRRLGRNDEAQSVREDEYKLARSELRLWNLSRDLGVRAPTPDECEEVAGLYEALNKTYGAVGWRRLASQLQKAAAPRTELAL